MDDYTLLTLLAVTTIFSICFILALVGNFAPFCCFILQKQDDSSTIESFVPKSSDRKEPILPTWNKTNQTNNDIMELSGSQVENNTLPSDLKSNQPLKIQEKSGYDSIDEPNVYKSHDYTTVDIHKDMEEPCGLVNSQPLNTNVERGCSICSKKDPNCNDEIKLLSSKTLPSAPDDPLIEELKEKLSTIESKKVDNLSHNRIEAIAEQNASEPYILANGVLLDTIENIVKNDPIKQKPEESAVDIHQSTELSEYH